MGSAKKKLDPHRGRHRPQNLDAAPQVVGAEKIEEVLRFRPTPFRSLAKIEEHFVPAFPLRLIDVSQLTPLAILVFLVLWRESGIHKGESFVAHQQTLIPGAGRNSIRRAIQQLEQARWIEVDRAPGCLLRVKVLQKLKRKK
jgi:hypothetical protein